MEGHQDKLMNVFWLRPAFQGNSLGLELWRSFKKRASSTYAILLFFLLLISLFVSIGWIDIAKYSGQSSEEVLRFFTKHSTNIPEFPLDCATWNLTNTCPKSYPNTHKPSNPLPESTCPDYFRWIHEDLRHWKQTGITAKMVEKARMTANFRLTILDGKVYVEKFPKTFQSRGTFQTRGLFTIWGIVQLARWYPGKLPDFELMFDCADRPVVKANQFQQSESAPPPVFRYCSDWQSLDIVFPDWSFWGWPDTNIRPWRSVLEDITEGSKKIKWEDREPYAHWKGNPIVSPRRGDLLKCNVTPQSDWNARLYVQDWDKEVKEGYKQSSLANQCTYRYKIYIEGYAWSVSEKYILACDSPVLLNTLRWYDFFIRGMVPQHHYWPIRDSDKCKSLKFAVDWGNNHTEKAKAIGEAGSRFIHKDLKMENVYDYMFHLLNEYAKLMKYKPTIRPNATEICPESMACSANGRFRKFMEESLEKSPRDSVPCTMPPPYDPQQLKASFYGNVKATKDVEAWENEFWDKQNKNH